MKTYNCNEFKYSIRYSSWNNGFLEWITTWNLLIDRPNLVSIIDILRFFMSYKQENVPYSYLNKMAFWFMVMTRRFEGSIKMSSSIIIPSNPGSFILIHWIYECMFTSTYVFESRNTQKIYSLYLISRDY